MSLAACACDCVGACARVRSCACLRVYACLLARLCACVHESGHVHLTVCDYVSCDFFKFTCVSCLAVVPHWLLAFRFILAFICVSVRAGRCVVIFFQLSVFFVFWFSVCLIVCLFVCLFVGLFIVCLSAISGFAYRRRWWCWGHLVEV